METERLPFAFMNAAGWAKTPKHVEILAGVPTLTHIVVGSFTMDAREGNTGGTNFYTDDDGTSVNSIGLRNGGSDLLASIENVKMVHIAHKAGKKIVLNIAGFSPEEYAALALVGSCSGYDALEINLGCPNVLVDGKHKEIAAYNIDMLKAILKKLDAYRTKLPLWLKLSPYANPMERERVARVIEDFGTFNLSLTLANTYPNITMFTRVDGDPALNVANNKGGMAGTALKWINLAQVREFRELLPKIPIIGVGGISTGCDIDEYHMVGATGFQIGTAFFSREDPRVFEKIVMGISPDLLQPAANASADPA